MEFRLFSGSFLKKEKLSGTESAVYEAETGTSAGSVSGAGSAVRR
jgi:hypothetical protein